MTYRSIIRYLESFINYERIPDYPYKESLELERVEGFLNSIGNPQDSLRCIHIAGTKGKGSTCAFITYILREAGYRVGLYTSPHLSDFRERIRILNPKSQIPNPKNDEFEGMIAKKELAGLVERFKPAIEKYNRACRHGALSFFEVYTSLAFVYFKERGVDFAVLETGLGGRLDATNVVKPYVCAITPISYEHIQKLGNTLTEIAREKAGIIKSRRPHSVPFGEAPLRSALVRIPLTVISAPQEKEAMRVIAQRCRQTGAKLYRIGAPYQRLKIRLTGGHQLMNASVAAGVIEALAAYGIKIGARTLKKGLYNTLWPGRCEVISRKPLIVLDGAQNAASARTLKDTIRRQFKYKKLILVLGISGDKDIKGISGELHDLADEVILTKSNNPRAAQPQMLAAYFSGKKARIAGNVKAALGLALRKAGPADLILVTGSLFVVGEARDDKKRYQ